MKSAYEKAMERLNKEAPRRSLSDAEKSEIAGIDNQADARIAETRLAFDAKLAGANPMEMEALKQEMQQEREEFEKAQRAARIVR